MYKNLTELFKENEGKGAVGAFNVHCFEMVPAMIQAAECTDYPSDFSWDCRVYWV